ncbi:hypothetical protein GCM10011403_29470 [Pseudohongiella nitratireducens]|uniref:Uncharacterized protein n=1 Tax=Pseudohongiella nitratireducens TaxID=1768907 RepID=A0A916VK13_9GAMM|nr:hypothetical protein [Pseudohongiella nitratireducens]GFZ84038.1 hypothetical protein GCM10011403_29470 [Pseudohongiella nitratireducens]
MNNAEIIEKSRICLAQAKALVYELDNAPVYIRRTENAIKARSTAVSAIQLVAELLKRVKAEGEGGSNGEGG